LCPACAHALQRTRRSELAVFPGASTGLPGASLAVNCQAMAETGDRHGLIWPLANGSGAYRQGSVGILSVELKAHPLADLRAVPSSAAQGPGADLGRDAGEPAGGATLRASGLRLRRAVHA